MKVSFLVTYYNQREYVDESIKSILDIEKDFDWEILVGDDGSQDDTVKMLEPYLQKYPDNIRLFVMPREEGIKYDSVKRASQNRLNLLLHASGDAFCTLDGDDFFCDKSFVLEGLKILERNPSVTVVAFGYSYYENGRLDEGHVLPKKLGRGIINKKRYMRAFYIPAGACLHRNFYKEADIKRIMEIGYFDDNNILISSLNAGEMYAMDKSIYAYRQTEGSVFNSMDEYEQAVLNVLGMDADICIVDSKYKDVLYRRNMAHILIMFKARDTIKELLGYQKYEKYLNASSELKNGLCHKILSFEKMNESEKKQLKKLISHIKWLSPRMALKYLF